MAIFALALAGTLVALRRIADSEAEVERLHRAKHAAQIAAARVREQHIQQVHVLFSFDRSHLPGYERAATATKLAVDHLMSVTPEPVEQALARRIVELALQSDRVFRDAVLPAIERGDRSDIAAVGARLGRIVDEVVEISATLDDSIETWSAAASARAAQLRTQASLAMLVCFGLAFVLSTIVGTLLTRSIIRPLSALAAGTERVGRGDLSARVDVQSDDELGQLAQRFNAMTEDLARHQEALVRSQKLASIGQVAAGVAHEINNPLGVILGYITLMRRAPGARDDKELQIVETEALQCQRIVQDMLDLARPQHLDAAGCDLAEVTRAAVARLEDAGALAGCTIALPSAQTEVVVLGDEGKLRQVVSNLVLNAVQAAPATAITVTVTAEAGSGIVEVADTGPGIPPDVLPHVFDPFFTTKREGTGLGLAIVQAIVEAHGGKIEIESTPAGTHARVRVPLMERKG